MFNQHISVTMKTSYNSSINNHKLSVLAIPLLFLKIAWFCLRKSYSAYGYVAYLKLFQNHLK